MERDFWLEVSEAQFNQIQQVLFSLSLVYVQPQVEVEREMQDELIGLHALDDAAQVGNS